MEIRVGQVWRERGGRQRTGTIRWFAISGRDDSPQTVRLVITAPNRLGIRPWLDIGAGRLRNDWECGDAPPVRQIKLTLAKDTTATECGSCSRVVDDGHGGDMCGAFDRILTMDHQRLKSCIAAEVK